MKKLVKKQKLMVGLVVGVATMICGFVAYAATGIVKTDNKLDLKFVNFKSTVKNNQVSSTDWDELMDTLESLKAKVAALEAESDIPSGAIMAFDSKEGCPEGWTIFDQADGKFLMGVDKNHLSQVSNSGGVRTVTLDVDNIPAHTHFYKDTVYSESYGPDDVNHYVDPDRFYNYGRTSATNKNKTVTVLNQGKDDVMGYNLDVSELGVIFGTNKGGDTNNYPIYGVRLTSAEVCSPEFGSTNWPEDVDANVIVQNGEVQGKLLDMYGNHLSKNIKNNCYSTDKGNEQQAFSVQNPYYKVVYCKKK